MKPSPVCGAKTGTHHVPLHEDLFLRLGSVRVGPGCRLWVAAPAQRAQGDALDAFPAPAACPKAPVFGLGAVAGATAAGVVLGRAGAGGDEHLEGGEGSDEDGCLAGVWLAIYSGRWRRQAEKNAGHKIQTDGTRLDLQMAAARLDQIIRRVRLTKPCWARVWLARMTAKTIMTKPRLKTQMRPIFCLSETLML